MGILKWNEFLNESSKEPSMDDLNKFFKDLMKGETQIQKHHKNYKIDIDKVKELFKTIVFTPEMIAELTKRKIEIPNIDKLKLNIEKTEYHRKFVYTLVDTKEEGQERFSAEISVEVPFNEEFEDDNTLVVASIWLKNRGKLKEMFGYSNKRLQKDPEFNYYSAGTVLQNAYKEFFKEKEGK